MGGSLRFGDPGVRLIECGDNTLGYFTDIPAPFNAQKNQWAVAPCYRLFGSEELSQRAEVIQSRMETAYLTLSESDAQALALTQGQQAMFTYEGREFTLPVKISAHLTQGQIGLPLGMAGISPSLVGVSVRQLRGIA